MIALETTIAEMYCPKCKEKFLEGSRRFCPTDGARLVAETVAAGGRTGGIFSSLVAKANVNREFDEAMPDIPQFVITEPEAAAAPVSASEAISGDYFEFEDIEPDNILATVVKTPAVDEQAEPRAARKIKPYEIPAGHVELGELA